MEKGAIAIEPGKPLRFAGPLADGSFSEDENAFLETFNAYRKSLREHLNGKFASLAELVPARIRNKCKIAIVFCSDGIVIRYETANEEELGGVIAVSEESIAELAPKLSDQVLRFVKTTDEVPQIPHGPLVTLEVSNREGDTKPLITVRPVCYAKSSVPDGFEYPKPPMRPLYLASIENEISIQFAGQLIASNSECDTAAPSPKDFLVHSRMKLPVGWEAIEVYPLLGKEYWSPECAPLWAELDILAIAARHNLHEKKLASLDPLAQTRKDYAALLAEFEKLLHGPEEPLHQFLKQHPELISPTSIKQWSKVPFGATKSDFVFREPPNDYELVEIEAPDRQLFRTGFITV